MANVTAQIRRPNASTGLRNSNGTCLPSTSTSRRYSLAIKIYSTLQLTKFLTLPPDKIDEWIASRHPILLQSCRKARCHSTCHVHLLTYFHPLRRSKLKWPIRPPNPHPHYTPTANTLITSFLHWTPTIPTHRRPPARPPPKPHRLVQVPFKFHEYPS
jgi:hypothetical protein